MHALLPYLIKMILASAVLYLYYILVLRNKKFHSYNRYYLLAAILLSLVLPLIKIKWPQPDQVQNSTLHQLLTTFTSITIKQPGLPANAIPAFSAGIIAISIALLVILSSRIAWIYKVKRTNSRIQMPGFTIIETNIQQAPFSFFNNLFWRNDIIAADKNGQKIFQHELAHITGRHSYDKLFAQVITCICWMNPFFWLIKKELTMIHEFIADAKSIQPGDVKSFAQMLLQSYNKGRYLVPAHSFFHSPVKRRLTMLSNMRQTKQSHTSRLLVLLVPAILLLLFSFAAVPSQNTTLQQAQKLAAEKNAMETTFLKINKPVKPPQ
jgi:BlaR1 peptidase M56